MSIKRYDLGYFPDGEDSHIEMTGIENSYAWTDSAGEGRYVLYDDYVTTKELLRWALEYIADGASYEDGEIPKHDCGYKTDSGHCGFHEKYVEAQEILSHE